MNKQPKQLAASVWKRGQSGNPVGRPIGARQKLSKKMLGDLEAVWGALESDGGGGDSTNGREVLRRLAKTDRLAVKAWNDRMLVYQGPAQPSPTIGDALNAGHG